MPRPKLIFVVSFAMIWILPICIARSDVIVSNATPRQKYTYTASLPGEWTQVPTMAGTQLTYALTWGTPIARTCTFRSDDGRSESDVSTKEKARALANALLYALREKPEKLLGDLSRRAPNMFLEDFYTTYDNGNVKMTLIYSYDDSGIISGQKVSVRSVVYETQCLFDSGIFVQATCNMLRDSYDVDDEELFRNIRDSISLYSK